MIGGVIGGLVLLLIVSTMRLALAVVVLAIQATCWGVVLPIRLAVQLHRRQKTARAEEATRQPSTKPERTAPG